MNAISLFGFRKCLWLLAMGVSASLLGGCGDTITDKDIGFISLSDTKALLLDKPGTAKAIDTRTPNDFARGHIPGAINLDLSQVAADKDSVDPALARYKTLIVYGEDAGSAAPRAMVKRFLRSGHKDPRMFAGGMAEWVNAGLQVEKSPSPSAKPTAK